MLTFLTIYGAVWLVLGIVVVVVVLWAGTRDEPAVDEQEPEGELIRVNFSGRGRAA